MLGLANVVFLATLSGLVVEDANGDGVATPGERALADVVVAVDGRAFARTDANGRYTVQADGPGVVWVRIPDGYAPRPTWAAVDGSDRANLDFALTSRPLNGPVRFVHASDSHMGEVLVSELKSAVAQASSGDPAPHFLAITGDLTQGSKPEQFRDYVDGISGSRVPVVSISGNHDFYDGGTEWRKALGPTAWSFDAGGVHFVVLAANGDANTRSAFLAADAAFTPPGMPVAAFLHYPLSIPFDQVLYDALLSVGTKWFFNGHYHANRILPYGDLMEYNVEPLVFGGMDGMPAGYQVVTIDAAGAVSVEHHTVAEQLLFDVLHPREDACVPAGKLDVVVALEHGPGDATVNVSLDGAAMVPAVRASAWDVEASVDAPAGPHMLRVVYARAGEPVREKAFSFCTTAALVAPTASLPDWPQLGGGPEHRGAAAHELRWPLAVLWTTPVGAHVQAPPVLAGERLYVPVVDYGTGGEGGVVALDARTGEVLWAHREGGAVHGTPAVAGNLVVYAGVDGTIRALDAQTGEPAWSYVLDPNNNSGKRVLHNGVTIAGDTVYGGAMYRFAALDLVSGALKWEKLPTDPPFPTLTHATPVVVEDLVIASVGRVTGTFAWETVDGAQPWMIGSPLADGVMASPIAADGLVVLGSGNSTLSAFRVADGVAEWSRKLYADGHDYAFWLRATPAVADGRLFVPTHRGELLAVSMSDGSELWSLPVGTGLVRGVHYEGASRGINASPVVTGNVVWVGGEDGVLRAARADSGAEQWGAQLGAPISGLVPAGDMLFVSGWDGSVRALVHSDENGLPPVPPISRDDGGCGCRAGAGAGGARAIGPAALLLLLGIGIATWRRRLG